MYLFILPFSRAGRYRRKGAATEEHLGSKTGGELGLLLR